MRDTPEEALLAPQSRHHHHHHLCHHQRASLITIITISSIIIADPYLTTINIPMTTGQHSPSPLPTLFHHHHHDDPITTAHIVLPTLAPLPLSSLGVTPITVTTITRSYTTATFIPIIVVTNTTTVTTAIITVCHQLHYQHHLHRLHYGHHSTACISRLLGITTRITALTTFWPITSASLRKVSCMGRDYSLPFSAHHPPASSED